MRGNQEANQKRAMEMREAQQKQMMMVQDAVSAMSPEEISALKAKMLPKVR